VEWVELRMPVAMRCHEEYAAGGPIDAIDPIVAVVAAPAVVNVADDAHIFSTSKILF